jgi:hypothetical protein
LQHHPLVQGIEQRLCLLLPDGLALFSAELFDLTLDLVDLRELLQCELGDLALVRCVQIEELAPCVSQAADLGHATGDQGFVAAEVVTGQAASPVTQEAPGVFARARFAEVVDDHPGVLEGARGICPEVSPVRFAIAGFKHRHRRLVGMQHAVLQQLGLHRIHQWL